MSRLVIVSNRVGVSRGRGPRAGGLEVALRDALRQRQGVWFGWSGKVAAASSAAPSVTANANVTYLTVDLGKSDHERYYVGYANGTLWPLLHFRLGLMEYRAEEFEGYRAVNAYLARTLLPMLRSDDVIWVHDYHLIPFGAELRKLGVGNRIGFFLHTPLPPPEVLVALPNHQVLMQALCAYDLIGFQTAAEVDAFSQYIARVAKGAVRADGAIAAYGSHSRTAAFPIGIDPDAFAALADRARTATDTMQLKNTLNGRALILGVDRLDYSKGIAGRFEAVKGLLSRWPEHKRQFTYLQIAPASRSDVRQYRALRRQIEETAGRVNGAYSEFDWTPIRYVSKSFPRETLAGFYRWAQIGLVTPFRDGMNLVAKEYVAAQNADDPGVLVLSRFAGAARELTAALLINPYDVDDMALALHRALGMPREERVERWLAMMQAIRCNTIRTWQESFLQSLCEAPMGREQLERLEFAS